MISEGVKDLPRFEDSQGKPRTKSLNEPIAKEESINIVKSSNPKENEVSVQEGAVSSCKFCQMYRIYCYIGSKGVIDVGNDVSTTTPYP